MDYRFLKQEVRQRFKSKCGYCGIPEFLFPDGERSFAVDHFRPKALYPDQANAQSNLVYACRTCKSVSEKAWNV